MQDLRISHSKLHELRQHHKLHSVRNRLLQPHRSHRRQLMFCMLDRVSVMHLINKLHQLFPDLLQELLAFMRAMQEQVFRVHE